MTSAQLSATESVAVKTASGDSQRYLPRHYCGSCMALVYERDARCLECWRLRPDMGWSALRDSGEPWLGRIIGEKYFITRRLGKGASAAVYEAESLEVSRQFAIKLVDLSACKSDRDPQLVRTRLQREVEAVRMLSNPHTVPFLEVLELSESCVAVVMPFIDGCTLDALVSSQGPLEWRRACGLLRQIATGVHAAHECGLIHRDLKPANIMVEPTPGGDEFVRVLDFGVVWMDDGVQVTRGFVGTPLYASPEQALGEGVDRRSDVYALGAILFFMLTGRPPFESDNIIEVLRMHVRHNPPTLAEASDYCEANAFPPQVQRLVEQMLSKSREARPEDLSHVIEAIRDLLDLDGPTFPWLGERNWAQEPVIGLVAPKSSTTAPGLGVIENVSQLEGRDDGFQRSCVDTIDAIDPAEAGRQQHELGDRKGLFESEDRDATGPKAAIFHRRPAAQHRPLETRRCR